MATTVDSSTPTPKPAQPRRRWYQFTLRTAGVWMVMLCLLLGSFAWWRDRAERQRKVVEELRGLGAYVKYHLFSLTKTETYDNPVMVEEEFFVCSWLRRHFGDDLVYDVGTLRLRPDTPRLALPLLEKCPRLRTLGLEGSAVTGSDLQQLPCIKRLENLELSFAYSRSIHFYDDDLAILERATSLRSLDLRGQPIGDLGLAHLRKCRRLQVLLLGETKVSDEGLQHLSELRELERLDLSDTRVTDRGLKHLRNLNRLTLLNLEENAIDGEGFADIGPKVELRDLLTTGTNLTDDALRHLTQFPQLGFFFLGRTRVTGPGITHLADIKGGSGAEEDARGVSLNGCPVNDETMAEMEIPDGWQRIFLDDTRITDEGFCSLKFPSTIEYISLRNTAVTDAALDHLHGLMELSCVDVSNTKTTAEGIKRFKARYPNCEVADQ